MTRTSEEIIADIEREQEERGKLPTHKIRVTQKGTRSIVISVKSESAKKAIEEVASCNLPPDDDFWEKPHWEKNKEYEVV